MWIFIHLFFWVAYYNRPCFMLYMLAACVWNKHVKINNNWTEKWLAFAVFQQSIPVFESIEIFPRSCKMVRVSQLKQLRTLINFNAFFKKIWEVNEQATNKIFSKPFCIDLVSLRFLKWSICLQPMLLWMFWPPLTTTLMITILLAQYY